MSLCAHVSAPISVRQCQLAHSTSFYGTEDGQAEQNATGGVAGMWHAYARRAWWGAYVAGSQMREWGSRGEVSSPSGDPYGFLMVLVLMVLMVS